MDERNERSEAPVARVMTKEEKYDFDDITIEDYSQADEDNTSSERPETFNEVYEDNGSRTGQQNFRQNFRSYGGNGGPRVYTFSMGQGGNVTTWQKWKYRIIGAVALVAVIWFLVFVALPVVAIGIVVAMIAYLLYNFFR